MIPTDQEFIALAREVLDPQVYPDLREFDGGPPEQPYDAAGWTLPMTMGVRVVTVTKPIADADRAKFKMLAADTPVAEKPTPYPAAKTDAALVRQRARRRIRHASDGGGDRSARRHDHRHRRARRDRSGRDECVPGAQHGVEGEWPGEPRRRPLCDQRPERCRRSNEIATSLAIRGERVAAAGQAIKKPRIALFEPPNSMDAGWTKWVLERYGFEFTSVNDAGSSPATSAIAST